MVFGRGKPCCCEFSVFILDNAGGSPAKQRGVLEERWGFCIGNVNRRSWKRATAHGSCFFVFFFFFPRLILHCHNMIVSVGNYTSTTWLLLILSCFTFSTKLKKWQQS